ncbi:hypothetical protein ACFL56_02075 [Candidatus Margulisiibacteriota bacterium]
MSGIFFKFIFSQKHIDGQNINTQKETAAFFIKKTTRSLYELMQHPDTFEEEDMHFDMSVEEVKKTWLKNYTIIANNSKSDTIKNLLAQWTEVQHFPLESFLVWIRNGVHKKQSKPILHKENNKTDVIQVLKNNMLSLYERFDPSREKEWDASKIFTSMVLPVKNFVLITVVIASKNGGFSHDDIADMFRLYTIDFLNEEIDFCIRLSKGNVNQLGTIYADQYWKRVRTILYVFRLITTIVREENPTDEIITNAFRELPSDLEQGVKGRLRQYYAEKLVSLFKKYPELQKLRYDQVIQLVENIQSGVKKDHADFLRGGAEQMTTYR